MIRSESSSFDGFCMRPRSIPFTSPPARATPLAIAPLEAPTSSNPAVETGDAAITNEWSKRRTGNKAVEAEAPSSVIEHKEPLHENEENVQPRPLVRMQIEAEPKMQDEQHADDTHRPHQETKHEGDSEGEFGQVDQWVDQWQERKEDVRCNPFVYVECRISRQLLRP